MRHTHATHALEHGTDLTAVRDNLRHASIEDLPMACSAELYRLNWVIE